MTILRNALAYLFVSNVLCHSVLRYGIQASLDAASLVRGYNTAVRGDKGESFPSKRETSTILDAAFPAFARTSLVRHDKGVAYIPLPRGTSFSLLKLQNLNLQIAHFGSVQSGLPVLLPSLL